MAYINCCSIRSFPGRPLDMTLPRSRIFTIATPPGVIIKVWQATIYCGKPIAPWNNFPEGWIVNVFFNPDYMLNNKKIIVVLPAYNASLTLEKTYREIPFDIVDDIILVDDASKDNTIEIGKQLGIRHIVCHPENKGYGNNQKTCYNKALELGGDIVIMLHPDYQYTPKLIYAMTSLIAK